MRLVLLLYVLSSSCFWQMMVWLSQAQRYYPALWIAWIWGFCTIAHTLTFAVKYETACIHSYEKLGISMFPMSQSNGCEFGVCILLSSLEYDDFPRMLLHTNCTCEKRFLSQLEL